MLAFASRSIKELRVCLPRCRSESATFGTKIARPPVRSANINIVWIFDSASTRSWLWFPPPARSRGRPFQPTGRSGNGLSARPGCRCRGRRCAAPADQACRRSIGAAGGRSGGRGSGCVASSGVGIGDAGTRVDGRVWRSTAGGPYWKRRGNAAYPWAPRVPSDCCGGIAARPRSARSHFHRCG
jgi:hypothetical protein